MKKPRTADADEPSLKLKRLSDLLELSPRDRAREQLRLLEALMARAVRKGDFANALKIFESSQELLRKTPPT